MKRIYILLSHISKSNGTERASINLANNLASNGYEVNFICISETNERPFYTVHAGIKINYLGINISIPFYHRIINYLRILLKLIQLTKNSQDIYIGTGHQLNFLIILSKLVNPSIKVIACEHLAYSSLPFYSKFLRSILYKKASKIVLLTKNDLLHYSKAGFDNAIQIPNEKSYQPTQGASLDTNTILAIGRLEDQKGYDLMIPIIAPVLKKYPNWLLKIYGDGSKKEALQNLIHSSELESRVIISPPTKEIEQVYSQASIYLMTSRYEGMPMVLIEAKSFGLPIVSWDCPYGPSEVIRNGEDGILTKMGDEEEIRVAICELIEDKDYRKKLGEAAFCNSNEFQSSEIFKKWNTLLTSL